MLKIKLNHDLPVEKKHKMTKGKVFKVLETVTGAKRGSNGWVVKSAAGENVKVLYHEASIVET